MYVLKDFRCSGCGSEIAVIPYFDKASNKTVVDCGRCVYCDKGEILPCDEYREFVRDFCKRGNL